MTDTTPAARAKRLLPLHDDAAPVVCTIGEDEKADRIAVMDRMRAAMTALERTDTGLLLQFPRRADIEADVRRFALDEKRCCQFWGFAVVDGDDELVLRWDGPETAGPLLDTLEAVLRSDERIERIEGLL
jgi:hypothetical protein